MPPFISNPIAYGVRTAPDDQQGGPLDQELVAGANVVITEIEVPPLSGNKKLRISSTGGADTTYLAATDPTPQNDSVDTAGIGRTFEVSNYWYNTVKDMLYICNEDTPNAAVWSAVDTTQYKQSLVTANGDTDIDLGDKANFIGSFLNYRLYNATSSKARVGRIYIGHNGTTAELRDEYAEVNGVLPITASALIDGLNHVVLRFTVVAQGSTSVFRYTESILA